MRRDRRLTPLILVVVAVTTLSFAACSQPTGAERVAALRGEYVAELNSFNVRETPVEPAMEGDAMADDAMEGDGMADGAMMDDGMEDDGMEEMMPVEVRQDVMLDVVLRKEGRGDPLPGVTIDVSQVGADEVEKARFRIYVDTSGLVNGSSKAVTHVLEDVDYVEGDGFQAEVRQGISPQSQADYREFNDASEGGG